LYSRHC